MKKIALAVALATLSATSMADVVLYGQIKGGVNVSKSKGQHGTTTAIVDYGSRIGFKGHEHLNGDLKAIWQLEQKVNIGGGSTGFGTRDSFIGLEGNFGKVTVGYQHGMVSSLNDKTDQWEYDGEVTGLGTFTRDTAVAGRKLSVKYVSPSFAGVSFGATVSPSDNNTVAGTSGDLAVYTAGVSYNHESGLFADLAAGLAHGATGEKDARQYLAQVGYDAAPWFGALAYQRTDRAELTTPTPSKFAGAKTVNEVAASFGYDVTDAAKVKATVAYGFGIKGEDGEKFAGNGKYIQGIVGADYALSKRTVANAQVGVAQFGKKGHEDYSRNYQLTVGMKHAF